MRKWSVCVLLTLLTFLFYTAGVLAYPSSTVRLKDIAKVQGVRSNQLLGYGLVMGLNGTGDSNKSAFTGQSEANLLKAFGVAITPLQFQAKNVAAVIITAQLPPFVKPGDTIDITVSSMGDAKSLQGGILLQTPLKAANGGVYAVAQGAVSLGGYSAGGGGGSQQKNFPTVGTVPSGAIVEKAVATKLSDNGAITLALSQPDFTTAARLGEVINQRFGTVANVRDPGTITVAVPENYTENVVGFVAALEELSVTPDNIAKVVINERTGTVVMGGNVTIDQVAVAQGGLTVKISDTKEVSQPQPLSDGKTVVTNKKEVNVKEKEAGLVLLPTTANVSDVVRSLNAVGTTPRDIIAILQAMKAAVALHAELQII